MPVDARSPLDLDSLRLALRAPWTTLDIVAATESTNADLIESAPHSQPGCVLVAEYQRSGRGRLDRSWSSPAGAGLTFSVLVRPRAAPARWGWLSLLTGVALCEAVERVAGIPVSLKWPNDLLSAGVRSGGKLAGILAQAVGASAVIGIGLNVSTTSEELPVPTASSLAMESARSLDRGVLLIEILACLGLRYRQWDEAAGDAEACGLAEAYRARCGTVGQDVRLTRAGSTLEAHAIGVDSDGQLRLRVADEIGEQTVAAGDIVHLRTTSPRLD